MLKAVYRRGAGAYSTSHAPKMSRDGWAMARVNAFLNTYSELVDHLTLATNKTMICCQRDIREAQNDT